MIYDVKEFLKKFFSSRLFVLAMVIIVMFGIVLFRIFSLQIINGASYQENFTMNIERTITVNATRGNIYDDSGELLAYNELAYAVTIADTGSYSSTKVKNAQLNEQIHTIVSVLERNGDSLYNDFQIDLNEDGTYSYNVSGTSLRRFLADVFGRSSYDDLKYNETYQFDEANATAEQVMTYLLKDSNKYQVSEEYDQKSAYQIVVVRYGMSANRYSRYRSATIANDVSDETVAYMNEHSDELIGVSVEEDTIRKYNYSEYFATIIGRTGRIDETEYETLHAEDESYTTSDYIGKSGLEQYYESYLRGQNGERRVYVDNVGRISEVVESTDSRAGSDLYLSINAKLQAATYDLLEQEIAGILYDSIQSGDLTISDVYFALINNNVIDIEEFTEENASESERSLQASFEGSQSAALSLITSELNSDSPTINNNMSEELLDYITYIISMLRTDGILLSSEIDTSDETYVNWRNGRLSPKEYLNYCITQQWIDITLLDVTDQYADSSEIYGALCDYILTEIAADKSFSKLVYQYMVERNEISGRILCLILFDQGVIDYDGDTVNNLSNGTLQPYNFLMDKIYNLEITPAQLALDPCTGSCVITDVNTGEIKALVSYPGYDNNRLANTVDAEYFAGLNEDMSRPQYNYATQEQTAPGSTFKMVTSTAGLAEGVITTESEFNCTGVFEEISNQPRCWRHSGHGVDNLAEAIRDSCNVYFYTVGFRLSQDSTLTYNDALGIEKIQKYASIFGLDEKTGVEIEENTPSVATEYPVMAAIGQSNNNFTTISLARYVTAVTSGNLYDYQLMSKIVDADGNVLESYTPTYEDISGTLSTSQWDTIHSGMRMVVEELTDCFLDFPIAVAGKTGTAQQDDRPNHALFVGYAPYDNPTVSIATRIANGYTSHNAAAASRNILAYYFGVEDAAALIDGHAEDANGVSSRTD